MPRNQIAKRYFLYRTERLDWDLDSPPSKKELKVVEQGSRFWRVKRGDSLVFTQGQRYERRFVAIADVINVESEEEGETKTVTATIEPPLMLPEGLTLGRFMYSLVSVYNFRTPARHMKHRRLLPEEDVRTLQDQRIAWDRTVFFGLLEELPENWRALLEHASRARRAAKHLEVDFTGHGAAAPEPVAELLELIQGVLLVPARLAADVAGLWPRISDAPARTITVGGAEQQADWGNFGSLLARAASRREAIERHWGRIAEIPLELFTGRMEAAWRPHKW
jgi:hypothetical protein